MSELKDWSFDGVGRGSKAPADIQDVVRSWTNKHAPQMHVWVEETPGVEHRSYEDIPDSEIMYDVKQTTWDGDIITLETFARQENARKYAINYMRHYTYVAHPAVKNLTPPKGVDV